MNSTHLTGRSRVQLAAAVAIDGHNWLYPVAYRITETKSKESWILFIERMKQAIGHPIGLPISTDAGTYSSKFYFVLYIQICSIQNYFVLSTENIFVHVGKGLEVAAHDVYPGVEHRECMRHL